MGERREKIKNIYFLPEDLEDFQMRLSQTRQKVMEAGEQIGEAASGGGDTWHDNFAFEQAMRDHTMWSKRLVEMSKLVRTAKTVEPDYLYGYVGLGRTATFLDEISGEIHRLRIGSYITFKPESISYCSPIARLLLGAEVGEIRNGKIGNEEKKFKILNVE